VTPSPATSVAPLPRLAATHAAPASEARWERWIPEWVRRLAAPVWVTGPTGRIVFMNERAERLLGVTARESVGRPCHAVVASRTPSGAAFCGRRCAVVAAAEAGAELAPVDVQVGGQARRPHHWLQMTTIPVDGPDRSGSWMVHTAREDDRAHRLEQYVGRIARRSEAIREIDGPAARRPLSPRERDVLELLSRDVEPSRIAAELGLSYVTVRNHVQHVLAKLGAHSVDEAVAMHVLGNGV
jgi:DNA-binding CsgD family transcriptional regulator